MEPRSDDRDLIHQEASSPLKTDADVTEEPALASPARTTGTMSIPSATKRSIPLGRGWLSNPGRKIGLKLARNSAATFLEGPVFP